MWKRMLALTLSAFLLTANGLTGRLWFRQRAISARLIRLHVVAASDAPADQARKLRVRDALLPEIAALTADCADAGAAERALRAGLPALQALAVRTLGTGEPVLASLGEERFPRRDYDSFSLPAGDYQALRLRIGPGLGHNWWCVAFPALCLPAAVDFGEAAEAAGFSREEIALMTGQEPGVRLKFRVLDWLAELFTN